MILLLLLFKIKSSNFRSHKKSRQYFELKWLILSQNVSRSFSGVFLKVSWLTLFPDQSPPRTSPEFPGLLLVFVGIMPDKAILDHQKSYLVYFENFHLLLPIFVKNRKNKNFQNCPNITFYGLNWLYLQKWLYLKLNNYQYD